MLTDAQIKNLRASEWSEAADEIDRLRKENLSVSRHCALLIEALGKRGATHDEIVAIAASVRNED